jgi:hypothetical protein
VSSGVFVFFHEIFHILSAHGLVAQGTNRSQIFDINYSSVFFTNNVAAFKITSGNWLEVATKTLCDVSHSDIFDPDRISDGGWNLLLSLSCRRFISVSWTMHETRYRRY